MRAANMTRRDAFGLILCLPMVEACGLLFDPSLGSISGTWRSTVQSRSLVGTAYERILRVIEDADGAVTGAIRLEGQRDPLRPFSPPSLLEGSHRGSNVKLTLMDRLATQHFKGEQVDPDTIEGFVFLEPGSEHRAVMSLTRVSSAQYDHLFPGHPLPDAGSP